MTAYKRIIAEVTVAAEDVEATTQHLINSLDGLEGKVTTYAERIYHADAPEPENAGEIRGG